MSGQAPAVDNLGNIFVTTGNGTTGVAGNPNDPGSRGESLLKLSANLQLQDFFTPADWQSLNDADLDYGSDGAKGITPRGLCVEGRAGSADIHAIGPANIGLVVIDKLQVVLLG